MARYVPDSSLRTACPPSFDFAPCGASSNYSKTSVFVVGKTTVCRIFNCQRALAFLTHDCASRFLPSILSWVRTSYSTIRARPMQAGPESFYRLQSAFAQGASARRPLRASTSEGWHANRSSFATLSARLRQGYGGQPPRAFMSGGWRIPGSNR